MDGLLNTILDFILLFAGCLLTVTGLTLLFTLVLGQIEAKLAIPWIILLMIGGIGIVKWSVTLIINRQRKE